MDSNLVKGYQAAVELAGEQLRNADPAELAGRCGGVFDDAARTVVVEYLNRQYTVTWPEIEAHRVGADDEVPLPTRVLLLNYVLYAHKTPSTGEMIAYRDIPGAATYEPSFQKRAVAPLVKTFDGKPELLYSAAEKIGGWRGSVADASVVLRVLPLLEVTYGIWHSDEEAPASGVILFESSVRRLMSPECIIVAASSGVYDMIKAAYS
ncbi:MAG: DUF3786 domain-containing protein [Armatimonadota bacterium]|nr:DUF3786 domain-containing protein [bacterium]